MKIPMLAASAALLLPIAASAAVPQLDLGSFHSKAKMTTTAGGQNQSIDSEWWVKGKKTRMEIKSQGMAQHMVNDGAFVYMWQPGTKQGMKLAVTPENSAGSLTSANDCLKLAKEIGADTIDGTATHKYEYKDCGGQKGITTTLWIADKTNAPKKMASVGPSGSTTILFTDQQVGASIADAQFAPPADVQFQDMSEMAKRMGQGAPPAQPKK
jgi:outer membrane lipoprotein-sorting protein